MIRTSGIPSKDVSLYIEETGGENRVIAALHEETGRTPASVIKVLTTYASVLKLGFGYRWPTQFYMRGRLTHGLLEGDLLIKGFGDPTLGEKDLPEIVSHIRSKGITKITGNIVIDRTYFNVGDKDNSGFDQHTYSPYNAMPDAMMFNERVTTICITPRTHSVTKKIPDGSYKIVNHLHLVNKPCRGRYSWPSFKIDKSQAAPTVLLRGPISKRCGPRKLCQVITKPYKTFYYALKDALKKDHINVGGRLHLGKIPQNAQYLFTHYSQPLEKIVAHTAKKSDNLYARQILLSLGAKVYGAPSTLKKGRMAVASILRSQGALSAGRLKIDNGCGLSRRSKITARLLAKMYDHAYRKYGKRWMETLSIAGVDGTIRKRFRGTIVRKRAWMKTGTLKHVKNIGGYVRSRNGKIYTVVILVNTKKSHWKASQLQNNIIKWVVKYRGGAVQTEKSFPKSKPVSPKSKIFQKHKPLASPSKTIRKNLYYIQVGSFSKTPDETYFSHLADLKFSYIVKKEGVYKVLIGDYRSREEALRAMQKIKKELNPHAFIVTIMNSGSDKAVY